jgi:hypothetical protein
MLRVDAGGKRFIDYLGGSESEFDGTAEYFAFLEQHARLVREKLAATSGGVRAKFEWLARYHTTVVEELLAEFREGRRSTEDFRSEYQCDPMLLLPEILVEV